MLVSRLLVVNNKFIKQAILTSSYRHDINERVYIALLSKLVHIELTKSIWKR